MVDILYVCFPLKAIVDVKMIAISFLEETEPFFPLMSAVQSAEHRQLFIMVKASQAPSTCGINQSFCDGAAGVCLAGN